LIRSLLFLVMCLINSVSLNALLEKAFSYKKPLASSVLCFQNVDKHGVYKDYFIFVRKRGYLCLKLTIG
jgi:hypothetical protein